MHFSFFLCYYVMNRGRWGVGVERRRPGSGVATSRGLREATATAGTPGSGSRVRAQISQCLSSQISHEVWRIVKLKICFVNNLLFKEGYHHMGH